MTSTRKTMLFVICCAMVCGLSAQSAFDRAYAIFQTKCIQCHSGSSPEANLDLQGKGAGVEARKDDVYNNLVRRPAFIPGANSQFRVHPGRADLSFLYRKISNNFDTYPGMSIDKPEEGQPMPPAGMENLSPREIEEIRQWILYGAPRNGSPYESEVLDAYYADQAIASFPQGPPPAPATGEGIQIRMGPFYIEPAGEVEYYQKYALTLPFDADVHRIDAHFGNFSHHFLIYDFDSDPGSRVPDGLRKVSLHQDVSLVMAFQNSASLSLPNNTAFFWEKDIVLDLNTHYINYSGGFVYQAEVYVNIYFNERGNARHQMRTSLIPKLDIVIPNNGQTTRFEQAVVNPALGEIFVWAMAGHTHQLGTSYKVFHRNSNGSKGPIIYDGACPEGIPGCAAPYFDYQHIPFRVFTPLHSINMRNGFIHEATYMNDGPATVRWGPTSDDEMMLLIVSFVTDTSGITGVFNWIAPDIEEIKISPNPLSQHLQIELPTALSIAEINLWSLNGLNVFRSMVNPESTVVSLQLPFLNENFYILSLVDPQSGKTYLGKVLIRH